MVEKVTKMPRPKREIRTASKEAYNEFKIKYPDIKITYQEYTSILYKFNENLYKHILETGDVYKIPHGFGKLTINKKKQITYYKKYGKKHTILGVDWKASKELGTKVYHMNFHTDQYRFKWLWRPNLKTPGLYLNDIWVFKPARILSRTLAQYLKIENSPYIERYNEHI